jgi:hypothetical protein
MMIATTGFSPKVMGSRSAIAPQAPRPGRTPTAVPITTPRSANRKFVGWSATENP